MTGLDPGFQVNDKKLSQALLSDSNLAFRARTDHSVVLNELPYSRVAKAGP